MGSLGDTLRSAREEKGLSLKDIADRTRINHAFLKAIEEENFSIIPGEVFITGFLKTYSKELGLNEKEVLGLYKAMKPPAEPQPEPEKAAPALLKPLKAAEPRKIPLYWVILAGLVLGAILTAVIILMTPQVKPAPVQPAPQKPVSAPAPAPFKPLSSAALIFETKTSVTEWKR